MKSNTKLGAGVLNSIETRILALPKYSPIPHS